MSNRWFARWSAVLVLGVIALAPVSAYEFDDSEYESDLKLESRFFSRYVTRLSFATPVYQEVDYIEEWDSVARLQAEVLFVSPLDDGWNLMSGFALVGTTQEFSDSTSESDSRLITGV